MTLANLNNAEELLIILSYNNLTAAEKEKAQELINVLKDWEEFFFLAKKNKIIPHLYHQLHKEGWWEVVPRPIQAKLEARANEIKTTNKERLEIALPVLKKIVALNVDIVILKGVMFAESIYENSAYKRMNDIDILVRKESVPAILKVFEEERLICIGERIGGKPEKQLKTSHHLPPFIDRQFKCLFGIQWGLKSPLTPYKLDYDMIWTRVQPFDFKGVSAKKMSTEDNLHHICAHLGYYKTNVRDIFDIYNLMRFYKGQIDWDYFMQEVEKAGTESLVYFSMSLANKLCPCEEKKAIIEKTLPKAKPYYRKGVAEKTKSIATLLRVGCTYPTQVEKALAEFNATNKFSEKLYYFLQTWRRMLFPPMDSIKKMAAILKPNPLQLIWLRLTGGYRVMKYIASEISWKLLILMMIKSIYDVIKCGVRSLTGKAKPSIKDQIMSTGVSEEELMNIKKNIQ